MFRYVSFVWNDAKPAAREAAKSLAQRLQTSSPEWHATMSQSGLMVFHAGARPGSSEPYVLHGDAGVVLGKLFTRAASEHEAPAVPLTLDARETASIVESGGRHLIDRYWGRYVAFLRDPASRSTWILRDPTGGLPCLTMRHHGVDVYFSLMEDGARLGIAELAVNYRYLIASLCYQRLELHETGLQGVFQVLGGECVEQRADERLQTFYWDPLRIAVSDNIEDPALAANELRTCTRACVQAWASCYSGIVHTLSGGLDSTIVLSCLQDAPTRPRITCVNHHSPGSDSDERAYARIAAQRAGCELVELERDTGVSFEALRNIRRAAVPMNYRYFLENSRNEARLAADRQATALFNGEGGDQLFYQARAIFAAEDYLRSHGARPELVKIAFDAAHIDRLSVWNVLRQALTQRLLGRRWDLQKDVAWFKTLIRPEVIESVRSDPSFVHPCFRDLTGVPSGKIWHAYQLVFPWHFYDPLGLPEDPERVAPLLSQPLIELCLRIPTYVLTLNGWDRAIARRAFRHDLPSEIGTRRTKGGMEEYSKSVRTRNGALMREWLLEGFLVRENVLDRSKVEEVLSGDPTRIGCGNAELYDCLNIEAWIRRWFPEWQRAAA